MPGSINKIQKIVLPFQLIFHLYGMTFYSNSAFALQVHVVKHLIFKIPFRQRVGCH